MSQFHYYYPVRNLHKEVISDVLSKQNQITDKRCFIDKC